MREPSGDPAQAETTAHLSGGEVMSHPDAVLDVLREVRFLEGVDAESLRHLATIAEVRAIPAGTVLFWEGQSHPWIYLIAEGTVALEMQVPGEGQKRLQTVGEGELLGWSPLMGGAGMTATARTVRSARVVAIDAAQLTALCEHEPRFGLVFLRRTVESLASRLRATRLQLMDVYRHELPVAPSGQEG